MSQSSERSLLDELLGVGEDDDVIVVENEDGSRSVIPTQWVYRAMDEPHCPSRVNIDRGLHCERQVGHKGAHVAWSYYNEKHGFRLYQNGYWK